MPNKAFRLTKGVLSQCKSMPFGGLSAVLWPYSGVFLRFSVSISSENPDIIIMSQCNGKGRFCCQSNISGIAQTCCRACVRAVVSACVCRLYKHKKQSA